MAELLPLSSEPVLMIHCKGDPIVNCSVSVELKQLLDQKRVPNELVVLDSDQHYPENLADQFLPVVLHFMKQHFTCVKEGINMKIAVTYEDGKVFQHFGHTETFRFYTVTDGTIVSAETVPVVGSGHSALAGFLLRNGVDTLICGGIGAGAKAALAEAGIRLYGGVTGNADAAVSALLNGTLDYQPDVACSHHEHAHSHTEGCGGHECGHHCGGHHA